MRINSINNFYQNKILNSNNTNSTLNNISQMKFSCPCDIVSFASSCVSNDELMQIRKDAFLQKEKIEKFFSEQKSSIISDANFIFLEAKDERQHVFDCMSCFDVSKNKFFTQTPWGTYLQRSIRVDENGYIFIIEETNDDDSLIRQMIVSKNNPIRIHRIVNDQMDVFDFTGNQNEFVVIKNLQINFDETEDCDAIYSLKPEGNSTILLNSILGTNSSQFEKRIILRNLAGNIKSVEFNAELKPDNSSSAESRYVFDYNQTLIHCFENYSSQISTNISWEKCYSYEKDSFYSLIMCGCKPIDVSSTIEAKEAIYKNSSGRFVRKNNPKIKFPDFKIPQFLN